MSTEEPPVVPGGLSNPENFQPGRAGKMQILNEVLPGFVRFRQCFFGIQNGYLFSKDGWTCHQWPDNDIGLLPAHQP